MHEEIKRLLSEAVRDGGPAVFSSTVQLRPASGWEHPVLRAAVYSDGSRTWRPNEEQGGPGPVVSKIIGRDGRETQVAIVESVEARAHDLTLGLRRALEDCGAGVPCLELYEDFQDGQGRRLIADSWEVPHRVSDPFWREALLPHSEKPSDEWPRFFDGEPGRSLNPANPLDPAVLLRWYPTALLFGTDPRAAILSAQSGKAARNGRGRRKTSADEGQAEEEGGQTEAGGGTRRSSARPFGRLCRSEIVAEIDGLYWRTQSLRRPVPAMLDATIYKKADGDWTLNPNEAMKDKGQPAPYGTGKAQGRASAIGLDDVTPAVRGVPDIYARKVTLSSYVSFAGMRAIRFPTLHTEQQDAARHLLVAMAVAAVLGAEQDLRIRSDCDLVLDDDRADAVVRRFSYPSEPGKAADLDYAGARELLGEASRNARAAGVWDPETIQLVASKKLKDLIVSRSVESGGGA